MHTLKLAAALIAAHVALGTGLAAAAEPASNESLVSGACAVVPRDQFKSETELRTQVEKFRYQVMRVHVDAGCYGVLAADRNGKPYELKFRGADLRMVSRYEVKGTRQ
jgi:hypothetical protein